MTTMRARRGANPTMFLSKAMERPAAFETTVSSSRGTFVPIVEFRQFRSVQGRAQLSMRTQEMGEVRVNSQV